MARLRRDDPRRAAALLAALGLLLGPLAGCRRESPSPPPGATPRIPQQVLKHFSLRQTSTEGLLWVLEAQEGRSYGPGDPIELTQMRVRFYDGSPQVRSTLTSRSGTVQEATQALVATDSVVVATPGGDTLRTDSLRWDPRSRKIRTSIFFTLTRGRDRMTGIGLEADPELTHYRVNREVRANLMDQGGDNPMEIIDGGTGRGN